MTPEIKHPMRCETCQSDDCFVSRRYDGDVDDPDGEFSKKEAWEWSARRGCCSHSDSAEHSAELVRAFTKGHVAGKESAEQRIKDVITELEKERSVLDIEQPYRRGISFGMSKAIALLLGEGK